MTTALEGGEWSEARPGPTLPPGKTRYPVYRRLSGPQGQSGRAENLNVSHFYENIRTRKFCEYNILKHAVFVTELSSNAGISV